MQAMMRIAPPHTEQVSMSMPNTRLRRCAQVIAARRSAGVRSSVSAAAWALPPLPRRAFVTCARWALFGANTPWKRGVVHIPANWERDQLRNAPQPVALYDNAQFSLAVGTIGGDVRAAVSSMAIERAVISEARFGDGLAQAAVRLGGVQADLRTLFNPSLSYEAYFGGMLLPVVLHLFCVLAAVSALGREFRNRSVDDWLQNAGGSLPRALLGKLAPVGGVYLLFALAIVVTFAGWRGWTAAGSLGPVSYTHLTLPTKA